MSNITQIYLRILQVTIPLGQHGDRPISVSFLAYYGGDKFLLDTILDVYASLQDQADIASSLAPATDSNGGMEASEVMKEKVKLSLLGFLLSKKEISDPCAVGVLNDQFLKKVMWEKCNSRAMLHTRADNGIRQ